MMAEISCLGEVKETDQFIDLYKDGIVAHNSAYDLILRNDYENSQGECKVRENLSRKEKLVQQWCSNIQSEIDIIEKLHKEKKDVLMDLTAAIRYFEEVLETTKMCKKYRQNVPNLSKETDEALENERLCLESTFGDMNAKIKKVEKSLRDMEEMKREFLKELDSKIESILPLKACDHAKPLLYDKYNIEDKLLPYTPGTEEEWIKMFQEMVNRSQNLMLKARELHSEAENAIVGHKAKVAKARIKTDHALAEEVFRDKYIVNRCQELLSEVDKMINLAKLRIDSMQDKVELDNRFKLLHSWRLHRLNRRLQTDNIRDDPVKCLEDELEELDERLLAAIEHTKVNDELSKNWKELKEKLIKTLADATARLHTNRENCQSIRKHVIMQGIP